MPESRVAQNAESRRVASRSIKKLYFEEIPLLSEEVGDLGMSKAEYLPFVKNSLKLVVCV